MKIGIDVSQVVYGTGVSRYTKNLVGEMLLLDEADKFVLFGGALRRQHEMRDYLKSLKYLHARKVFAPMSPRMADFIWNRVHRLHIEKLIGKVDVFHSSDWTQPPSRAFKVTTIHDLSPIKFPKLTPIRIVETHKQRLEWVRKEVDRIIVPSQSIMDDLVDMKFDKAKIRVIHEAADKIYKSKSKYDMELFKVKYNVKKNYLLAVGVNARKNTERIIKAFNKIREDVPIELFIIGNVPSEKVSWAFGEENGVRFLGHVPEHDMPAFYTGAAALVYPSLYEGFGLPILESFACKTPVVTSDRGSMAEIGKGAAVLVNPESVESIVKGITKVLTKRNDYILKGMKRVKEYSWKKAAKETLEVYRESIEN
jgi:glycosyltransferase involved in cell wall biosynthesis